MNVDLERLGRLLTAVEEWTYRRDGWDFHPTLWMLYDTGDAATEHAYRPVMPHVVRKQGYAARRSLVLAGDAPPWDLLRNFVENMAMSPGHEKVAPLLNVFRQPGFLGAAVITASWLTDSASEAVLRGEVPVRNVPGSVEARNLWAVDRHSRVHEIRRVRGGQPVRDMCCSHTRGDFTTSLRILVDVILDQVPATRELRAARYPTLLEAMGFSDDSR